MYDQIRDLPLLIREKIYGYLPFAKYHSKAYIFLKTLQEDEYDSTYLTCGLVSKKIIENINENYTIGQNIEYFFIHRYKQNATIIIDKIIYDPKEIESLVNLLGRSYSSSSYNLLHKLLEYMYPDDMEKYGRNSDGEPNDLLYFEEETPVEEEEENPEEDDQLGGG
jgi:hypothetical protein